MIREGPALARALQIQTEAINQAAVDFIEAGLRENKTVKEILEQMHREAPFAALGKSRIARQWAQVWRGMVAARGEVPLPRRGGSRRGSGRPARAEAGRGAGATLTDLRATLDEMLELVSHMLMHAPDSPAKQEALHAFPRFVLAMRALTRHE